MHDRAVSYRRAAFVFVKPAQPPTDTAAFLSRLRDSTATERPGIEAVALVIQTLVISIDGDPVPSPITFEVQIRRTARHGAEPAEEEVLQYQLSRKLLLSSPETGGLAIFKEDAPSYLPIAGNDLSFATRRGSMGSPCWFLSEIDACPVTAQAWVD